MPEQNVHLDFTGDPSKMEAAFVKMQARLQEMDAKIRSSRTSSKQAAEEMGSAFGEKAVAGVRNLALQYIGLTAAINQIREAYKNWQQVIRETSDEASKAAKEMLPLAMLHAGGEKSKEVAAATELSGKYGVERGEVYSAMNILQSLRGSVQGRESTERALMAARLGIGLGEATQVEVLGANVGLAPGQALQRMLVAGKYAGSSPEQIAKVAPSLRWFDKENIFGFAAAGVITEIMQRAGGEEGEGGAGEAETYVKAGARAMTDAFASKKLMQFFKRGGLVGKSIEEKYAALAAKGITSVADLSKIGITDTREVQAASYILSGWPRVQELKGKIAAEARPGVFERELGGIEAELPETRAMRTQETLKEMYKNELARGPLAQASQEQRIEGRIRALAALRLGYRQETVTGMRLVSDPNDPYIGPVMDWWFRRGMDPWDPMGRFPQGETARYLSEQDQIRRELALTGPQNRGAELDRVMQAMSHFQNVVMKMDRLVGRFYGGPTLARPNEDR